MPDATDFRGPLYIKWIYEGRAAPRSEVDSYGRAEKSQLLSRFARETTDYK